MKCGARKQLRFFICSLSLVSAIFNLSFVSSLTWAKDPEFQADEPAIPFTVGYDHYVFQNSVIYKAVRKKAFHPFLSGIADIAPPFFVRNDGSVVWMQVDFRNQGKLDIHQFFVEPHPTLIPREGSAPKTKAISVTEDGLIRFMIEGKKAAFVCKAFVHEGKPSLFHPEIGGLPIYGVMEAKGPLFLVFKNEQRTTLVEEKNRTEIPFGDAYLINSKNELIAVTRNKINPTDSRPFKVTGLSSFPALQLLATLPDGFVDGTAEAIAVDKETGRLMPIENLPQGWGPIPPHVYDIQGNLLMHNSGKVFLLAWEGGKPKAYFVDIKSRRGWSILSLGGHGYILTTTKEELTHFAIEKGLDPRTIVEIPNFTLDPDGRVLVRETHWRVVPSAYDRRDGALKRIFFRNNICKNLIS